MKRIGQAGLGTQTVIKNRKELWQALQEEWINLDENKYKNLVDSMPRKIAAIIASKGNPTKY